MDYNASVLGRGTGSLGYGARASWAEADLCKEEGREGRSGSVQLGPKERDGPSRVQAFPFYFLPFSISFPN